MLENIVELLIEWYEENHRILPLESVEESVLYLDL